jgi:hypothetical protein
VNSRQPYEILIAEKLDSIQVPDMADAIWANIEMQLDLDPHINSGDQLPSDTLPVNAIMHMLKWAIIVITTAALITVAVFLLRNKSEKDSNQQTDPPATESPIPETGSQNPPSGTSPDGKKMQPAIIGFENVDSSRNTADYIPIISDSLTTRIADDSKNEPVTITDKNIIKLPVDTIPNTVPVKKPRGVSGINSSDYKIVSSKKDST